MPGSAVVPELARLSTAVFANVFGYQTEDYVEVARVLEDHEGLAGYELNVSCPNTRHGGIYFSSDPALLARSGGGGEAGGAAAADREAFAQRGRHRAAGAGGGGERRGRHLAGEYVRRAGHRRAHAPAAHRRGVRRALGPAIKPIALRLVYQAARAVKIPVVGLGGIATGEDAAEFLIAARGRWKWGRRRFWDPRSPVRIAGELGEFLRREKVADVGEIVGTLRMGGA